MKLKTYLKKLNKLFEEHPEAGDYHVVIVDANGDLCENVGHEPSLGVSKDDTYKPRIKPTPLTNAVCLNA